MKRFRSRRFAMLLILMLTLSMGLQGAATVSFADEIPVQENQIQKVIDNTSENTVPEMEDDTGTLPKEEPAQDPDGSSGDVPDVDGTVLIPEEGAVVNSSDPLGFEASSVEQTDEDPWDYSLWGDPAAIESQNEKRMSHGPKSAPEFYSGDESNLPDAVLALTALCFEEPGTQAKSGVTVQAESRGNGQKLDWESNGPIKYVYVKGKYGGNLYCYDAGEMEDKGLVPPKGSHNDGDAEAMNGRGCPNGHHIDYVIFFFEPLSASLTVCKTIAGGGPQENVEFRLQKVKLDETGENPIPDGGTIGPVATDANGQAVFEDLTVGAWYYVEENVPAGYTTSLNDSNSFIEICCCGAVVNVVNTPIAPDRGSLTVTKTFSDQNEAEVTVALYEETEGGDILADTQVTSGHIATFTNLDLSKVYKITESPVPEGYSASYPDGQMVAFGEDNTDSLTILNTVTTSEKGSLAVTKSYSNGNTAEVTVNLYMVTGEGDELVVSQVTEGLTTTFTNLNSGGLYKIVEGSVPSGYRVSYPDGQTVEITGIEAETLRILNTRTTSGGGGGGGGPSSGGSTTINSEPTPQGNPDSSPEPQPPAPEIPIAEDIIPQAVPVLPQTGELPRELFYGLGGMITALGAFLKRK